MNNLEFRRPGSLLPGGSGDSAAPAAIAENEARGLGLPFLTQVLTIIRRRKWLILGAIVGAMLLGLAFTLLSTPLYTSSATLEIRRDTSNFINVQGAEQENSPVDLEFYQTQYGLLRARSLAERVATDLRLFDDPQFYALFCSNRVDQWFEAGRIRPNASTREERIRESGLILIRHLDVVPERLSRLVDVRFVSPDPLFSRRIVDAWTRHFTQSNLERRFEATSYARRFLEERLAQLRTRIDESERRLVGYAAREGIVNLPTPSAAGSEGGTSGERALVVDDLANLNRALAEATADRIRAESRLGTTRGAAPEAVQNMAISGLRQRRAEVAADLSRTLVQFDEEYPAARSLRVQLNQLDQAIAREESRVQELLRQSYRASVEREQGLREQVGELKSGVLDLRRRSIQYNIFQRDADTNRQLYDALLQRYKEIGVAGGVGVNNISVVDPASTPERPSTPNLPLNMAVALVLGVLVAGAGAFAMEQIDQGITDPSEVEEALKVPLLGTIPRIDGADPIDDLHDKKSSISEAYLSLQTNLAFSTDHGVPRSLAVTSTRPAEGKTTTSFALASALARQKRQVVLIDADMRSPSIHQMLGLRNERGISNFLAGDDDLAPLVQASRQDNLSVITTGPQPPSAPELLSSERFDRLIASLLERFDHVVLDAPPVMGLADAPLIASRVESTVFVVEAHGTHKNMAGVAIGRLRSAHAQISGAVLTKFNARRAYYGYGYDYGYGYGYGSQEKSTS